VQQTTCKLKMAKCSWKCNRTIIAIFTGGKGQDFFLCPFIKRSIIIWLILQHLNMTSLAHANFLMANGSELWCVMMNWIFYEKFFSLVVYEDCDCLPPRLPACLCIHHDMMDTFGCGCSPSSCQYKVNLSQNNVMLSKK
jgi:hypothetical protein